MVQEQTLTDEISLQYIFKKTEPVSPIFAEYYATPKTPKTPGEWFSLKFPDQAESFGPPFLEARYTVMEHRDVTTRITPTDLNEDFFAAILGGDKALKHDVVFFEPERRFYFYDCRLGLYAATTEEKLQTLLSQYFVQAAEVMPSTVDVKNLVVLFRADDTLKRIIKKARSLLAADASFFSADSRYRRIAGPEIHNVAAKEFVRNSIVPSPNDILTVTDCFKDFNEFCRMKGMPAIERRFFREMIAEIVKEELNLGVRHDLMGSNNRAQAGWKGLTTRLQSMEPVGHGRN